MTQFTKETEIELLKRRIEQLERALQDYKNKYDKLMEWGS